MNKDIDWAIRQTAPHTCKHVLMVLANRADKQHQCYPSLTSLAADTGMTRRSVGRCVQALESLQLIARKSRGIQTTVYTLLVGTQRHHSTKDSEPSNQGHSVTTPRDTVSPLVGTQSHHQNGKVGTQRPYGRDTVSPLVGTQSPMEPPIETKLNPKGNGEPKSEKRKTKPPLIFPITSTHREWAAKNGVTANLENETEQMLDHFRGKGETRLDWEATWRTWMRNSIKFNRNGANGNGKHRETDEQKNNRALKAFVDRSLAPEVHPDVSDVREDS